MIEIFEWILDYLVNLSVQLSEIKGFSDSSFRYHVDDKDKYQQYINKKIIIEMPGGIKADKLILAYCIKHEKALLISQDLMREYYKYFPYKDWILEKRVALTILDNEIFLTPMLDEKIEKRYKNGNKKFTLNKNSNQNSITTLDVVKIIEESGKNSEFELYSD